MVAVYNGTDVKSFFDGVLNTTDSPVSSSLGDSGGSLLIGGYGGNALAGLIDEVRIYNRALSVEEIRYHYNKGGPVAHWSFDEGNGTTTYDGTDNNNDGVLGDGSCSPDSGTCPKWVSGKYGSALLFDGENDYVDVGNKTSLQGMSQLSLGVWVKSDNVNDMDHIFHQRSDTYFIRGDGTNSNWMMTIRNSSETEVYSNVAVVKNNKWTHLALTYDGNTVKYYQDGTQIDTDSLTGNVDNDNDNFYIGTDVGTNRFFNGLIDDVRIYNYARTAEQIRIDYNQGMGTHF